ncbi:hypothetical protein FPB0191_01794 [Frischella perrara]|uniref:Uncharacterized protein n=1 Tax=Frischella perrara TaxID=1267021 RepID=A0A0A7S227_FRIPE|nr:hypothetical protein [Frischella perrara]AJA45610.1 hypothetical protein FPB0191_01794 [Frischella perrara]
MIVRIELNQLENRSNYYFYNDILFTGEAYDHRDNQLYQVYEITDGEITGSRDYGFFETNGMIKVDYDLLQSGENFDYEMNQLPYYFQGQPFTGVMYEYRFGFVLSEAIFINSWLIEHISFYPDGTGRIRLYEKNDIDPTETTGDRTWYLESENNSFKRIESRYLDYQDTHHTGELVLFFNDQNQIQHVNIKGDYAYVSYLVPRDDLEIDFKTFNDLLAKQNIFADNLSIWSIEDALFNQWLDQGLLNQVKQLELYHTQVKPLTLTKIQKLQSLQELKISESKIYEDDDPLSIKLQKQRFTELASALYSLKESCSIHVILVDDDENILEKYLPNDLKHRLPKQE